MTDRFNTIIAGEPSLFKDRGSKFHGYSFRVDSIEDVDMCLDEVRSMHPSARHVCYAYRIGLEGETYRINDDGEPSGSAGQPIYGQLQSVGVTNVLVAVVRYFGGTKLGVPGLINAYKTSARESLDASEIVEEVITKELTFHFDYPLMNDVMTLIKRENLEIVDTKFEITCTATVRVPLSEIDNIYYLAGKYHTLSVTTK